MADCEIYLQNPEMTPMVEWIEASVGEMDWISENDEMVVFHARAGGDTLPIIVQKEIADTEPGDKIVGIWFNSIHAPWESDADCARDAFKALGCTVQCDPGDAVKGKDKFMQIDALGESLINLSE